MADIARANNRLQNTNNESTTIQIRLIKIRTFSKSLSICTGILLSSTCNINNLPNYSRVQILCRKTKENVKQYNMLSKIDGIQSNNTIDNKTITMSFVAKREPVVRTTAGAIVFKSIEIGKYAIIDNNILSSSSSSLNENNTSSRIVIIKPKIHRHEIFATWICQNFKNKDLTNILDIAGGKCKLSQYLLYQNSTVIKSTIIDPAVKEEYISMPEYLEKMMNLTFKIEEEQEENNDKNIDNDDDDPTAMMTVNDFMALQKSKLQIFPMNFDQDFDDTHNNNNNNNNNNLVSNENNNYTAIFGLHPDQATDAIFDYALKHKIPFACIPCCIFKTLFPNRILKSGQKISTYNGLIKYLREKDPRIRLAQLPFVGRNIVLYMCSYDYDEEMEQNINNTDNNDNKKKKKQQQQQLWCDDGWFSAPSRPPSCTSSKQDIKCIKVEDDDDENHVHDE